MPSSRTEGKQAVFLGFRLYILKSEEMLRSNARYGKRATGHFYFDWDFKE